MGKVIVVKRISDLVKRQRVRNSTEIDWVAAVKKYQLSRGMLLSSGEDLDWHKVSQYQKLDSDTMMLFANRLVWPSIAQYQKLSNSFIDKFATKLCFTILSRYQKMNETIISKYSHRVDWVAIYEYQKLSPEFRERYQEMHDNQMNAQVAGLKRQKQIDTPTIGITVDAPRSYQDEAASQMLEGRRHLQNESTELSSSLASRFKPEATKNLTPDTTKDNNMKSRTVKIKVYDTETLYAAAGVNSLNSINWNEVLERSTLTEPMLKRFADKINFDKLVTTQTLSHEFILENVKRFTYTTLLTHQNLSKSMLVKVRKLTHGDLLPRLETRADLLKAHGKTTLLGVRWVKVLAKYTLSLDLIKELSSPLFWRAFSQVYAITDVHAKHFNSFISWGLVAERNVPLLTKLAAKYSPRQEEDITEQARLNKQEKHDNRAKAANLAKRAADKLEEETEDVKINHESPIQDMCSTARVLSTKHADENKTMEKENAKVDNEISTLCNTDKDGDSPIVESRTNLKVILEQVANDVRVSTALVIDKNTDTYTTMVNDAYRAYVEIINDLTNAELARLYTAVKDNLQYFNTPVPNKSSFEIRNISYRLTNPEWSPLESSVPEGETFTQSRTVIQHMLVGGVDIAEPLSILEQRTNIGLMVVKPVSTQEPTVATTVITEKVATLGRTVMYGEWLPAIELDGPVGSLLKESRVVHVFHDGKYVGCTTESDLRFKL